MIAARAGVHPRFPDRPAAVGPGRARSCAGREGDQDRGTTPSVGGAAPADHPAAVQPGRPWRCWRGCCRGNGGQRSWSPRQRCCAGTGSWWPTAGRTRRLVGVAAAYRRGRLLPLKASTRDGQPFEADRGRGMARQPNQAKATVSGGQVPDAGASPSIQSTETANRCSHGLSVKKMVVRRVAGSTVVAARSSWVMVGHQS